MLILFLRRLAAGIRQAVPKPGRARSRRALNSMLMFDDHLLRDIGLTRADLIDCLSTPSEDEPINLLEARRKRNASVAAAPSGRRLAA